MGRFQNFDEIYSALFVGFDNIYTRLLEQGAILARTFASNPQRWLRWLEGHALRMMYGKASAAASSSAAANCPGRRQSVRRRQ
jgi:hypothetical protein